LVCRRPPKRKYLRRTYIGTDGNDAPRINLSPAGASRICNWQWPPIKRVSTAYGFSQALDGTWEIYRKQAKQKNPMRTHFDDAVDFMGWYSRDANQNVGISKTDAYHLYLAYHDGVGGFQKKTYLKKPFLLEAANKVKQREIRYRSQLAGCKRASIPITTRLRDWFLGTKS
jgi:hypothetical protein